MSMRYSIHVLLSLFLVGCGGGGNDEVVIVDPRTQAPVAFINWIGNPAGEIVKDLDMQSFKFTVATSGAPSCLWDMQLNSVIFNYCHVQGHPTSRFLFVDRYVDVRLGRLADGGCTAAVVDAETGFIVDLFFRNNVMQFEISRTQAAAC